jgi:uncharacterized protein (DUF169 family)
VGDQVYSSEGEVVDCHPGVAHAGARRGSEEVKKGQIHADGGAVLLRKPKERTRRVLARLRRSRAAA